MIRRSLEYRFWSKVKKTNYCWLWLGVRDKTRGYGRIAIDRHNILVHRESWELAYGDIPDGQTVDHKCVNKHCVNPRHLQLVSRKKNKILGDPTGKLDPRNTSGYRGVSERNGRWRAMIRVDQKLIHLGTFGSKEEAAKARDEASLFYFGNEYRHFNL